MSITLLDPKNFVWAIWLGSLDEVERRFLRPREATWHAAFMSGEITLEDVRLLLQDEVRRHYAGSA